MRLFLICSIAITSAMFALTSVASAESFTTRIETRPYYGAVTTIEHGVKVIRPLPPDRFVIINPNRTPLSLGISETNVYGYGASTDYGSARGYREHLGAYNEDGPIYSYPAYGPYFGRHFGRFGNHFRPGHPGMFPGGHGGKGLGGGKGAVGGIGMH
jgi:hypothetical protein